jgi:hypothetical protein
MKQWYWIIPFLFLATATQAQNFQAGFHAGLSGTQVDGDGLGGYHKLGLYTSLFVSRTINTDWSWQFELAYSQKGSRRVVKPETLDAGPWIRLQMHYIDIPLLINWKYNDRLSLEGGLSGNILLSWNYNDLRNYVLNTHFKRFETALLFGGRYELRDQLSVFFRANYSMFSIDPQAGLLPFFAIQRGTYNNLLTLGLRYQLTQNKL